MAWVKLDDQFSDHPKVAEAGPLGVAMHVAALCYANRHLTDGYISRAVAARLVDFTGIAYEIPSTHDPDDSHVGAFRVTWPEVVEGLVSAGMWEPSEHGWYLHDYLKYNPSRADAVAKREEISSKRAEAGRKGLAKRWQSDSKDNSKPIAKANQNDSPNPNPVSSSLRSEELTPPQPDAFAEFFAAYPRHDARAAAEKAWNARTADERIRAMTELPRWKGCEQWHDPKYIPQASTYLNQRRFDDELPPPSQPLTASRNGYQSQADHNQLRRDANGKLINVH